MFGMCFALLAAEGLTAPLNSWAVTKGGYMYRLRSEQGAAGWGLLWLLGIPIPILLVLFVLRGCT